MKKVIVGLSGGVDSSVAALLLKEQGYTVEGLFMRNWDSFVNQENNYTNPEYNCSQEQDYQDALEISKQLDIKLHRVDFVEEYWKEVFTYFVDEYKEGRTPNPDILCNSHIKFKYFKDYALNILKADFIATGHYCKNIINNDINYLSIAKDHSKDQTYFLCDLTSNQLKNVLFPIGDLLKKEVRKIAKLNNLITADKKDSTGICFIGKRDFKEFLENYIPNKKGNIVDWKSKKIIGRHDGVMYYTIGQRQGLSLSGFTHPYFVIGKNINKKELYVGLGKDDEYLYATKCLVKNFNWINKDNLEFKNIKAKFRYRQDMQSVTINEISKSILEIIPTTKQRALTPGQFCVLYKNDICLGGGIITEVFNNETKCVYL